MQREEGPTVAELLAALDEGGGVQGDDKWKRLGIDFDKWNWWSNRNADDTTEIMRVTPCRLDDPKVRKGPRIIKSYSMMGVIFSRMSCIS